MSDVPQKAVPWIGSLFPLGGVVVGPIAFLILDQIGRKKTLISLSVPMLVGYGLLTSSYYLDNIVVLLVGRFLSGNDDGKEVSINHVDRDGGDEFLKNP